MFIRWPFCHFVLSKLVRGHFKSFIMSGRRFPFMTNFLLFKNWCIQQVCSQTLQGTEEARYPISPIARFLVHQLRLLSIFFLCSGSLGKFPVPLISGTRTALLTPTKLSGEILHIFPPVDTTRLVDDVLSICFGDVEGSSLNLSSLAWKDTDAYQSGLLLYISRLFHFL